MAKSSSLEWGIGGEFQQSGEMLNECLFPHHRQRWEEQSAYRVALISKYVKWLDCVGRTRDAEAVNAICTGDWWPHVSGDTVWWKLLKGKRCEYTGGGVLDRDVFERLVGYTPNERCPDARFYPSVIEAIMAMARATRDARESSAINPNNHAERSAMEAFAGS